MYFLFSTDWMETHGRTRTARRWPALWARERDGALHYTVAAPAPETVPEHAGELLPPALSYSAALTGYLARMRQATAEPVRLAIRETAAEIAHNFPQLDRDDRFAYAYCQLAATQPLAGAPDYEAAVNIFHRVTQDSPTGPDFARECGARQASAVEQGAPDYITAFRLAIRDAAPTVELMRAG